MTRKSPPLSQVPSPVSHPLSHEKHLGSTSHTLVLHYVQQGGVYADEVGEVLDGLGLR